jgi:hypothetical protein
MERGRTIAELLASADEADTKGQADQALTIRRDVLARFGKFTDAAPLLAPVRALVPEEKKPAAAEPPK